jgi:hypothetical protein
MENLNSTNRFKTKLNTNSRNYALGSPSEINNKNNIQSYNKITGLYENPDLQKDQIYSENQGKAGIYR